MKLKEQSINAALKVCQLVSKKAILFYIILAVICSILIDDKTIEVGLKVRYLNMIMPTHYSYLFDSMEDNSSVMYENLNSYTHFYEKVVKYFPERSDGYGFLGYCYALHGANSKAMRTYREGIKLNSDYFWDYYNLGILNFKAKRYEEAALLFKKAIDTDPDYSLKLIRRSTLFNRTIIYQKEKKNEHIASRLKEGYNNSLILLKESLLRSGEKVKANSIGQLGSFTENLLNLRIY